MSQENIHYAPEKASTRLCIGDCQCMIARHNTEDQDTPRHRQPIVFWITQGSD